MKRQKYTGGALSALCGDRMELLEMMLKASNMNENEVRQLTVLIVAASTGDPEAIRIMNMDPQEAAEVLRVYLNSRSSNYVC